MSTQLQFVACAEMAKQMLTGQNTNPPFSFAAVYTAVRLCARAQVGYAGHQNKAEISAIAQGGLHILMQEFAKDWLDNETMVKLMNEFAQEQLKQQAGR